MEEVPVVPAEDDTFFYENISNLGRSQVVQNSRYIASWTPYNGKKDFIFLNKKRPLDAASRKNPKLKQGSQKYGWKLHIRIDSTQEDNNLRNAWNAIVNILVDYEIVEAKIITEAVRRKMLDSEFGQSNPLDLGKEITVYLFKNTEKSEENWQRFIDAIESALEKKGIRPGRTVNPKDKVVSKAKYSSCRDDTPDNHEKRINPLINVEVGRLSLAAALEIEYPIPSINQQSRCSSCCRTSLRK